MDRNHDERIVVLDVEQFDRLVGLANVGAFEVGGEGTLKSILRHARRFNSHLAAAHATSLAAQREIDERYHGAMRSLLKTHAGKTVFIRETDDIYREVVLVGKSRNDARFARVREKPGAAKPYAEVHVSNLVTDLPNGFASGEFDLWDGKLVRNRAAPPIG